MTHALLTTITNKAIYLHELSEALKAADFPEEERMWLVSNVLLELEGSTIYGGCEH